MTIKAKYSKRIMINFYLIILIINNYLSITKADSIKHASSTPMPVDWIISDCINMRQYDASKHLGTMSTRIQ